MWIDVETEVVFLLKCAKGVEDEELLSVIEGIRQKDPIKIPYIQDAMMKRNKGESVRVARLMLRTTANRLVPTIDGYTSTVPLKIAKTPRETTGSG